MKKTILTLLCAVLSLTALYAAKPQVRTIEAEMSNIKGEKSTTYMKCVGAGRAAEGLRGDWQAQLATLQKEAPFEYIRFHGLLHDDMGVYFNNNGKEIYNFQYIDALYDFLLSINIKPFVELSFMPHDLRSGEETIFWWKGNITPPADYDAWARLITAFTEHVTERYGSEEVRTWYFEVWNEPNISPFFTGTQEDYFKIYKYTAEAVKGVDPTYKVGGPATAGNGWVEDIIVYCNENNVPLDFIATHTYGVYGALDEYGTQQLLLGLQDHPVAKPVNKVRAIMDSLGQDDMELHYTEWSSSYSPRDKTHDTYLNAAYVLHALRHVDGDVTSMSYWTFTDIFEESGVPTEPLHGGFGLMTMNGLKKPTYYSYQFLSQLGGTEVVSSDENSWVCKDKNGNIQILAYDITMPEYGKKDFNNTIFAVDRPAGEKGKLKVNLTGVEDGLYNMEIYKTGYRHNDIQTIYCDLGQPHNISPAQYKALENHSQNAPYSLQVVEVKDGKFTTELSLFENDVYYINLRKL